MVRWCIVVFVLSPNYRYIRVIKAKVYKYLTLHNTFRYKDHLQEIVSAHNHTWSRTLGMRPDDVSPGNQHEVFMRQYKPYLKARGVNLDNPKPTSSRKSKAKIRGRFAVGQHVRLQVEKPLHEKKYHSNFSQPTYIVSQKLDSVPITYRLKTEDGTILEGRFYDAELTLAVPDPADQEYIIDKVLD